MTTFILFIHIHTFTPLHGSPQDSGPPGQRLRRGGGREGRPERVVVAAGGVGWGGGMGVVRNVTRRGRPRGRWEWSGGVGAEEKKGLSLLMETVSVEVGNWRVKWVGERARTVKGPS
jgi:hypothetical protein